METKDILEGMDKTLDGVKSAQTDIEAKVAHIETELAKSLSKFTEANVELSQEEKDALASKAIRAWFEDGTKDFNRFKDFEQKALVVGDSVSDLTRAFHLVDDELGRQVIEQMREPTSITGMVGSLSVGSTRYRQPVLHSYPTVVAGAENVAGTASPDKTATQVYREIEGAFIKVYSQPQYTNEAALDPHINIVADLRRLLADEEQRYVAQQILFGDGTTSGDMRGILNARIDLSNTYAEALKPDGLTGKSSDRDPDIYQVIPTGIDGAFGSSSDSAATLDYFIEVVNSLNSQWHSNASWLMNRRTLSQLMKLRDLNGQPYLQMDYRSGFGYSLLGFPIQIEDYMPNAGTKNACPIIFGDLSSAFRLLPVAGSDNLLQDPYTVKGTTILYHEWRLGECVFNNDAIKVCIQATDTPTS